MFERLNRVVHNALDPEKTVTGRQPTVEALLPGDVISLWDGGDAVVRSVLECTEMLNERETRWRWNLLDGGRMLETSPDGTVLFGHSVVFHQKSAELETLTSDAEQGGVLKAFEARVQDHTAARNPVLFEYQGSTYRVTSTGTFLARPVEEGHRVAAYPSDPVWCDIDPAKAAENVYFVLEPTTDAEGDVSVVVGLWTTHIAVLFGTELKEADIQSIYPRSTEGQQTP